MITFWRNRFGELSKRSKAAFWVTIVASLVAFVNVAFQYSTQSDALSSALSSLNLYLDTMIIAGLAYLGMSMMMDKREKQRG